MLDSIRASVSIWNDFFVCGRGRKREKDSIASANARHGTRERKRLNYCAAAGAAISFLVALKAPFITIIADSSRWRIREEKSERERARRLQMRWLVDFESRAHFLSLTTADVDVMLAKSCSHASFFISSLVFAIAKIPKADFSILF
jgi:hypothetical protein